MQYRTTSELTAALDHIRQAPSDGGAVDLIVRRPTVGAREILPEGRLDPDVGLAGDNWLQRGTPRVGMQLTLMNSRVSSLVARDREHQAMAGDQLHVDFDLSSANVPPGTRLSIGEAVIEVSDEPHTGCRKFKERFGADALDFVNAKDTRELHLRGICAKVVLAGTVREGDSVRKL